MSKYTQSILQRKVTEAWSRCEPLVNKAYHDPDNFSEMDGIILEASCLLYESAQRRLKRYNGKRI